MIRTACAAVLLSTLAGSPVAALHCLRACVFDAAPSCHRADGSVATWSSTHDCAHDRAIGPARTATVRLLTARQIPILAAATHASATMTPRFVECQTPPHITGDLAPPSFPLPLRI
jgi:hypothetical protein